MYTNKASSILILQEKTKWCAKTEWI